MKATFRLLLVLNLILVFPFMFLTVIHDEGSRLVQEILNAGHVVFFGSVTFILATTKFIKAHNVMLRIVAVLMAVMILAAFVEVAQFAFPERTPDIQDFLNSMIGGVIVLLFLSASSKGLVKRIGIFSGIAGLICFSFYPLWAVIYDEISVYRSFPVLSGLESTYEMKRWSALEDVKRVEKPVKNGRYALEVRLPSGKYPGVSLQHFPPNWSKAGSFQFSVYNPGDVFVLHFRIHDSVHETRKQRYEDRFNSKQRIYRGWNTITVPMAEIENAPETRLMDLEKMRNFTLYLVNNEDERLFYVDDVRLIMSD